MEPEGSLPHSQVPATPPYPETARSHRNISPGMRFTLWLFRNMTRFYGEELLAPRPTPKLEDHPLSAVCDCLFNIYSQLPSILEAVPPSATRGRAMPWWQGPTYCFLSMQNTAMFLHVAQSVCTNFVLTSIKRKLSTVERITGQGGTEGE